MKLNVDNLLYQLATEWLHKILTQPVESHTYLNADDVDELQPKHDGVASLEDEIMIVMLLCLNKQKQLLFVDLCEAQRRIWWQSNT